MSLTMLLLLFANDLKLFPTGFEFISKGLSKRIFHLTFSLTKSGNAYNSKINTEVRPLITSFGNVFTFTVIST